VHSRMKRIARLALPLVVGIMLLLTALPATSASAASAGFSVIAINDGTNGDLWYYDSTNGHDSGLPMAGYTSPAIVEDNAGYVDIAYQSATNHLSVYEPYTGYSVVTSYAMSDGNSPSISQNDYVAFGSNTYQLMTYIVGVSNSGYNTGFSLYPGSSPAISLYGSEIAYMNGGGHLSIYNVQGKGNIGTSYAMEVGTSPAIGMNGGESVVAFAGTNGDLWYYVGSTAYDTGYAMATRTSPSIDPGSREIVAFQASNGHIATYTIGTRAYDNTTRPMDSYTSPSIGPWFNSDGVYEGEEIAYVTPAGALNYTQTFNNTGVGTGIVAQLYTSPSYSAGAIIECC
jgi:hypothetical protein